MSEYKAKDLFTPVDLADIRLTDKIADLMDTFFHERVMSDFARSTIYRETEDAFLNQIDDEGVVGIWQGEYWGKWIIGASRVCRYNRSDELKTFIGQAAHNLMALQREDGYIGTYKNSLNVFSPDPQKAIEEVGYPSKWNWNIWCRKYTLWGLLESYELTEDEEILRCAVRLADHLLSELSENHIDITKTGTFCGVASCSIMKPMLILYRHTENEKYLDFCKSIADRWEEPDAPGLICNSLAMKKIDDWYEDTLSWSKTYESLSCFDGLLELYRVTGERKYLEASECFCELLEKYEKNLLFSVGYNDQYFGAADEINVLTEPCDVIHYIRVCYELFKLTGKVKYMDSIELVYYNAFLASACKDGKWGARTVRGSGKHEYAYNQAKMKYNHCCVNNMPRGFLNAAECTVLAGEKEVLINMYHPYDAKVKVGNTVVTVKTSGDYIADSSAVIGVTFDGAPVDIVLRIPAWSKESKVTVGGVQKSVQSGFYRVEATGQIVDMEIQFDNTAYVKLFRKPVPRHSSEDWQYRKWGKPEDFERSKGRTFLDAPRCIIQKGAILLCRSKLIGNTAEEMFDGSTLVDECCADSVSTDTLVQCPDVHCELEKFGTGADVMVSYIAHFTINGNGGSADVEKVFSAKVCDYAFAANMVQDDPEYFSIYF